MPYKYSTSNYNYINNYDDMNVITDFKSFLNYVINHYEKFLLLLLVFIIIYLVDYLSYINAIIYATPQIIPNINNTNIKDKTNTDKINTNHNINTNNKKLPTSTKTKRSKNKK